MESRSLPALRTIAAPRPRALSTLDTIYLALYRNQPLDISNLRGGYMWEPFVFRVNTGHCGERRARWGWDAFGGWGAGGGPRGRHWKGRTGRLFEQGDLKYVILRLLEEKPGTATRSSRSSKGASAGPTRQARALSTRP